jgi:hypothetical protein
VYILIHFPRIPFPNIFRRRLHFRENSTHTASTWDRIPAHIDQSISFPSTKHALSTIHPTKEGWHLILLSHNYITWGRSIGIDSLLGTSNLYYIYIDGHIHIHNRTNSPTSFHSQNTSSNDHLAKSTFPPARLRLRCDLANCVKILGKFPFGSVESTEPRF